MASLTCNISNTARCGITVSVAVFTALKKFKLLLQSNYDHSFKGPTGTGQLCLSHLENAIIIQISPQCKHLSPTIAVEVTAGLPAVITYLAL